MRRRTLLAMILYAGINTIPVQTQNKLSNLSQHCFDITPERHIGIEGVATTPENFVRTHLNVDSAINGTYFDRNDKQGKLVEGIAYLTRNRHFGNNNPGQVRGYFTVNIDGDEINVARQFNGSFNDYWLVLGTYPLLVLPIDNKPQIHPQAQVPIYNSDTSYRSAIGTKNGQVCFAVSEDSIKMNQWAERLQREGYRGAINLDGGPVSQLAERKNGKIETKGKGKSNTRLVIFEYTK